MVFKKIVGVFIFLCFCLYGQMIVARVGVWAADPTITGTVFDPLLDISLFSPYKVKADIANFETTQSASLVLNTLNGNTGDGDPWDYYIDGRSGSGPISLSMSWLSGSTWQSQNVYPDYIYPEIYFAPSSITWANTPQNISTRRNSYQIFHFNNPFTMVPGMNFWIEFNAAPVSTANSADLLVYLVKKGKSISFFNTDWRSSGDVELVGTINRNDSVSHTHSTNSSHYLVSLSTNLDGTVSTASLDISGDFWIVLYNTSPNTARGWSLRYQPSSLCNYTDRWYLGNFSGWTTTLQSGCPDAHVHLARRDANKDGVKVDITAGVTTSSSTFYFNTPANLAPNGTSFVVPKAGAYSGSVDVSWDPTSDANGDVVSYNLYLEDSTGGAVDTLETDYALTSRTWDSTAVADGEYRVRGQACDASLCTDFYSENFTVLNNPAADIYSLTSVSLAVDTSSSIARVGNTVTLTFSASGEIGTPSVSIYSGGESVVGTVSVVNVSGNNWEAGYVVDEDDTSGMVTFSISASNLDAHYYDTTDGSSVTVDKSVAVATITSSVSSPVCVGEKPSQTPDLFQIDVRGDKATLFFTPIENTSRYYISYSERPLAEEHGVEVTLSKSGVQNYTVGYLKYGRTYYFKVRGSLGCVTGEWSNVLAVTTGYGVKKTTYRYFPSLLLTRKMESKKIIDTVSPTEKPVESVVPTSVPLEKISNVKEEVKKKFCFLRWCF